MTRNPNALWVVQQLREAWAYKQPHGFMLFDRDAKLGIDVVSAVRDLGSQLTRTAFRCPWQNGVAERWVRSCRRDLLDDVIILNERHLKRLLSCYLLYYHEERNHQGKGNRILFPSQTEARRNMGAVRCRERLGGLLKYYEREAA